MSDLARNSGLNRCDSYATAFGVENLTLASGAGSSAAPSAGGIQVTHRSDSCSGAIRFTTTFVASSKIIDTVSSGQ